MKRRDFLKGFGKVASVATVAPVALSQLSKVIEPKTLKTALNSSKIIKERFDVPKSDIAEVVWNEEGTQWYFKTELETSIRFQEEIERQWMLEWENKEKIKSLRVLQDSVTEKFLSQHPMNGSLYS